MVSILQNWRKTLWIGHILDEYHFSESEVYECFYGRGKSLIEKWNKTIDRWRIDRIGRWRQSRNCYWTGSLNRKRHIRKEGFEERREWLVPTPACQCTKGHSAVHRWDKFDCFQSLSTANHLSRKGCSNLVLKLKIFSINEPSGLKYV